MYALTDNVPKSAVVPGDSEYEFVSFKGYVGVSLQVDCRSVRMNLVLELLML